MWILVFILLPIAFTASTEVKIKDHAVKIAWAGTILSRISPTVDPPSDQLDLSGLRVYLLSLSLFHDFHHVKNLSLANNFLSVLPRFAFKNLRKVEYLSLANNHIGSFKPKTFVGLDSLKILNLSNNPIKNLRNYQFFGIPKSCDILTLGNDLDLLENELFEDTELESHSFRQTLEKQYTKEAQRQIVLKFQNEGERSPISRFNRNPRLKICIQQGTVKLLDIIKKNEIIESDCRNVRINYTSGDLFLNKSGISNFERGWYRIQDCRIHVVLLEENDIVGLSKELLNDLPIEINSINLTQNKIERVDSGIENEHLKVLVLDHNFISEIEDGAFQKTNLKVLSIEANRLNSTKFVATLPSTLNMLSLFRNQIAELPDNSFAQLNQLQMLRLGHNKITVLTNQSFRGLSSLQELSLQVNQLYKIAPGAFQHLKVCQTLILTLNKLKYIEKGVFSSLKKNALNHEDNSSQDFPASLQELDLRYNAIENLKSGTFVNVPKSTLLLHGNKISKIEKGSFDLPDLDTLDLIDNLLEKIDGDSFEGLGRLRHLLLGSNPITEIEKGAMKNLGSLHTLDLWGIPIKKLKNGAFFGLRKSGERNIQFGSVSIEVIQGGLFNDV